MNYLIFILFIKEKFITKITFKISYFVPLFKLLKFIMKKIFYILLLSTVIISCGVKVPYTTAIRDEFGLDTDAEMKKIQFYTSSTIILNQAVKSNSDISTDENGALVSSSSSEKETIIIPGNTKCVFDGFGPKNELKVRFESGTGKTLTFVPKGTRSKGFIFLLTGKTLKDQK